MNVFLNIHNDLLITHNPLGKLTPGAADIDALPICVA